MWGSSLAVVSLHPPVPGGYSRGMDCWRELPRKRVGGVFLLSLFSSRSRSFILGAQHTWVSHQPRRYLLEVLGGQLQVVR